MIISFHELTPEVRVSARPDQGGRLSKQRLLLSTCATLTAEEIFQHYAKRWSIEDMFNQLKNRWGWRETWQQSRQVLHRWTQIISLAYALPQLLAMYCGDQVQGMMDLIPWRKKSPVTASRVRMGLQNIFGNVRIRDWWNPKCRDWAGSPAQSASSRQSSEYQRFKEQFAGKNPPPIG